MFIYFSTYPCIDKSCHHNFLDVDECRTFDNKCHPGGTCLNRINHGNNCFCNRGYSRFESWSRGIIECRDIDECKRIPNPCSGLFEVCDNNPGSFVCNCISPGFHRPTEEANCTDIDECLLDLNICDTDTELCRNIEGSYNCECKNGFQQPSEGETCQDIDECATQVDDCPDNNGICENNFGSFACRCDSGYELESSNCEDIDECKEEKCSIVEKCRNSTGSFTCECIVGYEQSEGTCIEKGWYTFSRTFFKSFQKWHLATEKKYKKNAEKVCRGMVDWILPENLIFRILHIILKFSEKRGTKNLPI